MRCLRRCARAVRALRFGALTPAESRPSADTGITSTQRPTLAPRPADADGSVGTRARGRVGRHDGRRATPRSACCRKPPGRAIRHGVLPWLANVTSRQGHIRGRAQPARRLSSLARIASARHQHHHEPGRTADRWPTPTSKRKLETLSSSFDADRSLRAYAAVDRALVALGAQRQSEDRRRLAAARTMTRDSAVNMRGPEASRATVGNARQGAA